MKRRESLDMAYVSVFVALLCVCAWIAVPLAVPITLQTLAVLTAVGVLGGKRGTLAVAVYLLLGLCGVPVFAGFAGGVGALFRLSGGYTLGFLGAALVMWLCENSLPRTRWALPVSMVLGLCMCYVCGIAWGWHIYLAQGDSGDFLVFLSMAAVPFILPDAVKLAVAVMLTRRLKKFLK